MLLISSDTGDPEELAEVIMGQKMTRKQRIPIKQKRFPERKKNLAQKIPRKQKIARNVPGQKFLASKRIPQNQTFLSWCKLL